MVILPVDRYHHISNAGISSQNARIVLISGPKDARIGRQFMYMVAPLAIIHPLGRVRGLIFSMLFPYN